MKPVAGDEYGWHMPLVNGTEVGMAFHNGDPDRPYIANAFHDSEHTDIVIRDNRSQNILRTADGNERRMEDLRGEEHIALTTPHGASQLNQSHITDEQGKQRGSGFELRTDEYGVIRVAKGLFVTADGQAKAAGEILDMETALQEIEICQNQLQTLAAAAEQAQALEADIASQIAMFNERLKPLNGMIHFHGPEGVAFTSGEHMQLAAAENIAVNAGDNISTGSMGNTAIMAGEKMGLFARIGKFSVIASEGPVEMQAQNGEMHLSAEQKLSITAMGDILFTGKKRVTLIGGGSYLKIEEGKIEYGTAGDYIRKVKRTHLTAPATMAVKMPVMPIASGYSEFFTVRDQKTNKRLADFPYTLSFSGTILSGKTSDNRQTQRAWSAQSEKVELTPHPEQFRRELFSASYWDTNASLPLDFSDNDQKNH